ncbi:MAG TPA: porin [Gemmataceae bacterium]|nr:porin [Gemmataceae bacterium]
MGHRYWAATLAALALGGTAVAQDPAGWLLAPSPLQPVPVLPPPRAEAPPAAPGPLVPAPTPLTSAVPGYPAYAIPAVLPGPAADWKPTAPPVKGGGPTTASVLEPVQATPASPRTVTPPLAPTAGPPTTLPPPATQDTTTPGASPASSGAAGGAPSRTSVAVGPPTAPVIFKFKPGDEHLLQMEAANGLFKFYVGGRLQIDAVWMRAESQVARPTDEGGVGRVDDGTNFRRARFDFGGTFYKNIEFLMEFDFINTFDAERADGRVLAANTPAPTDMWVTFHEVPWVGNVRIGNQKPPISFEHMISSRFLNFMERSLDFDAFIENQNNGFEFGICAFDTYLDDMGTWAVGVFKNTRNVFGWNVGDGEYDLTARATLLPIYDSDGEYLVHIGIGCSHRDFDDDFDRVRARTLVRNGPATLHTRVADVRYFGSSRDQVVPELVAVWGPWTLQAEYYGVWVHDAVTPTTGGPTTNHGTVCFQGAYAELLYFLTGEHRYYNRKIGAFGRVTPNSNFHAFREPAEGEACDAGIGAWQVGVRYSWLDLEDNGIHGGVCHDITLGLNWFLNPYMKWQWNATALYRDVVTPDRSGWICGFGTRIAFDF